jgi:hypothetical protein
MRLYSNPKVTQMIDIYVVAIPDIYGLLLSRDRPSQLNGYFAIDYSHLWFSWKGQENKIRVNQERYMKYVVTKLEGKHELIMFNHASLGNYCVDTFFRDFHVDESPYPMFTQQYEVINYT